MRYFLLFICICLLSCKPEERQKEIIAFETVLGKQNTDVLNMLVVDFEENLKTYYPKLSLQKAYEQFLKESINSSETDYNKFNFQTENTQYKFIESGFKKEIYNFTKNYNLEKKDSITILNVNYSGKYMQALYAVKDIDSLTQKYYEVREANGLLLKELIVNGLLHYQPDFNNYLHKRIAIIEYSF